MHKTSTNGYVRNFESDMKMSFKVNDDKPLKK